MLVDKQAPANKQKKQFLSDYTTNCTEEDIDFTLTFAKTCNDAYKSLNLIDSKNTSMSNIHLYNQNGRIQKYSSPEEILEEFYKFRLGFYEKRRESLISKIIEELNIIESKVKFILAFVNDELKILNIDIEVIVEQLEMMELFKVNQSFDYLINMQIRSLTKKRIEELKKQEEIKKAEHAALLEITSKEMWKTDLASLKKNIK